MVLSVGVVGVTLWRVHLSDLRAAFRHLDLGSLFLAVFCILALIVLRAYKWHCLVAAVGNFRLQQSLRTLLGGCALGLITPGRIGELGRCIFVRKHERTQVAFLTLLDRTLDLWGLLTLVGASLFLLVPEPAAIFGLALWLALVPVVLGFPGLSAHLSQMVQRLRHFRRPLAEVATSLPPIRITRYAFMGLGAMWLELSTFYFLLRAFSPTGFATAVATYPYIALAGDLPLSFGGVGVREGVAALLLFPYAVPPAAAVDAALLWFVFGILFPAVLGIAWLVLEKLKPFVKWSDNQAPTPDLTLLPLDSAHPHIPAPSDSVVPPCEAG
ncbi:MAG TPA: lysylphosphatidylglycerol synthase transmembrane domain-containing protein [Terriglobia bacterium]|nr:lysylphosphatidylglycerol synthase transmembrane domain-containing protein [Terriglobia bacterium]